MRCLTDGYCHFAENGCWPTNWQTPASGEDCLSAPRRPARPAISNADPSPAGRVPLDAKNGGNVGTFSTGPRVTADLEAKNGGNVGTFSTGPWVTADLEAPRRS